MAAERWVVSNRLMALCLVLSGSFLLTLPGVSVAQERPTLNKVDQRLKRVEDVLDQSLLKLLQQIDGLQQEVRVLSGEVESLRYELEKQQQRNRELYRDTDRRITTLESGAGAGLEGGGFDETQSLDEIEGFSDETLDSGSNPKFVLPIKVSWAPVTRTIP